MAKAFSFKAAAQPAAQQPVKNYAFKPAKIGPVLTTFFEERKTDLKEVAAYMGVEVRTVRNWPKATFLSMKRMLKLSEYLQVNLLAYYNPNVAPLPDPRDAQTTALQKELKDCKETISELENDNGILKNRNIKLEGQLELAKEEISEFMRRRV